MKCILFLAISVTFFSSASCKSRDRCGDCPTFSKLEFEKVKTID